MRPITPRTSDGGLTCREPTPQIVVDVSPLLVWTGEHRRPRVKAIGSKTVARQTGQALHSITKTIAEKEETP